MLTTFVQLLLLCIEDGITDEKFTSRLDNQRWRKHFERGGGAKPMTKLSSPTTKAGSGVARNLKRVEGHNNHIFSSVSFFGRTNLKLIKTQRKVLGGCGACSPEIFEKCML